MPVTRPVPDDDGSTPWLTVAFAAAGLAMLAALVLATAGIPGLSHLEYSSADIRTALFSHRTAVDHPNIAIVAITDDTLKSFSVKSPIDRGFLADVVRAADSAGPRAIGLDVLFLRPTDAAKDAALQEALRNAKAGVVLGVTDERGKIASEQRAFQTAFVEGIKRPGGYLELQFEHDGVDRYIAGPAPDSRYPASFALLLARTIRPDAPGGTGRIAWLQKVTAGDLRSRLVNWDAGSPFTTVAAEDLLDPAKAPAARARLKDRIVLIGADFAYADRYRTPLTAWTNEESPGVAVHAQMVAQIIDGRRVTELDAGPTRLVVIGLACLAAALGWKFRYRRFDFLSWGMATVALILIDALVFSYLHVILPYLLSMLAWFSGVMAGHNLGLLYDWRKRRR